jgi:hypothetical protein
MSAMPLRNTIIISCKVVTEELLPLLQPGMTCQTLEFGLHANPNALREALQKAIDSADPETETILLGYGLCSRAVEGLSSSTCTLVIPKMDDCIGIFLGTYAAYRQQVYSEPGTYYLTKGWIEAGDNEFCEYDTLVERYGQERADRIIGLMLKHYTRLVYINTGQYKVDAYLDYSRETAERFGMRFEELKGDGALLKKMLSGSWDDDFVVAPPGKSVRYEDFLRIE